MNQGPFINAPFDILYEKLDLLCAMKLMPEIYFDANILDTYTEKDYKIVADRLAENGLACTIHAPFEDLRPASFDDKIRNVSMERLIATCHLAEIFKPLTIVCHPNFVKWIYYEKEEAWLERSIESWGKICDLAKQYGTRVLLENVFDDSPEMLARLVEGIGAENTGICLDIGHLTIFTKRPLSEWLTTLGPYIEELHLHDNHGVYDEHLVMGRGTIDFTPLFEYIKKQGVKPIYTLEQHREEDIEPNMRALHEWRERFGV